MKKAERQRDDYFELWYWRRPLRVPWTARIQISNQSTEGHSSTGEALHAPDGAGSCCLPSSHLYLGVCDQPQPLHRPPQPAPAADCVLNLTSGHHCCLSQSVIAGPAGTPGTGSFEGCESPCSHRGVQHCSTHQGSHSCQCYGS